MCVVQNVPGAQKNAHFERGKMMQNHLILGYSIFLTRAMQLGAFNVLLALPSDEKGLRTGTSPA